MKNSLLKILNEVVPLTAPLSKSEIARSVLAAFVAIFLVGYVSSQFISGIALPVMVASMGASAILVFAVPHGPMSQPWALIGGNLFPAMIAVASSLHVPGIILASAVSLGLSLLVMLIFRCVHPPGGAVALLPLVGSEKVQEFGYHFVLEPIGLNLLILLILGFVINNLLPGRHYPARAVLANKDLHMHEDVASLDRVGITQDDLHEALKEMDTFLDVSEEELGEIYKMAGMQAYRRKMGEITCADIMSRDLVSAEYGTELEEAWAQLRFHKIKAIPVVDKARRVIGIITLVDFLKRANLKTYETFEDKLIRFIRRTPGISSDKPEVVGQIMAAPVYTAKETMHIVQLVPLLSERGLHHIPVVDGERRLVGMVTQSDLIAALYAGSISGK